MCEAMPQSSFLQMPLHLVSLILSELDNIQSLGSAILSHSLMFAAFNENSKTILTRILVNQIPPNLAAYACITYDAAQDDYRNESRFAKQYWRLCDFFDHSETNNHPSTGSHLRWRLELGNAGPSFASSLSKTHTLVEYFTRRFLDDTLPLVAQDLCKQSPTGRKRPSEDEIYRISRAFYRYQLYCIRTCDEDNNPNLVGQQDRFQRNYKGHTFFVPFSPWVNEQFACIHDYLEGVLSKAFDEVASHDIEWGAKSVDWLSRRRENKWKQAYLSYGLDFLYKLDHADSYDERLQLLASKGLPCSSHGLAADLSGGARPRDDMYPQWPDNLGQWSTDDFDILKRTMDGPNYTKTAPFLTWRYAHRNLVADYSVFNPAHWRLRRCGYVLWDLPASKTDLKVFRRQIKEMARADTPTDEPEGAREEMERSWAERAEVYSRGGRGYWAPGDLSRVVWDDGKEATSSDQEAVAS